MASHALSPLRQEQDGGADIEPRRWKRAAKRRHVRVCLEKVAAASGKTRRTPGEPQNVLLFSARERPSVRNATRRRTLRAGRLLL